MWNRDTIHRYVEAKKEYKRVRENIKQGRKNPYSWFVNNLDTTNLKVITVKV